MRHLQTEHCFACMMFIAVHVHVHVNCHSIWTHGDVLLEHMSRNPSQHAGYLSLSNMSQLHLTIPLHLWCLSHLCVFHQEMWGIWLQPTSNIINQAVYICVELLPQGFVLVVTEWSAVYEYALIESACAHLQHPSSTMAACITYCFQHMTK